jgi:hypothetical protein
MIQTCLEFENYLEFGACDLEFIGNFFYLESFSFLRALKR